ncbi:S-layer homology domain-containing protein [Tissierellaceae bacterium HCP3S3_D8]
MGKMKRFFSLMLVLTIVLGSFGSVFAAEDVKAADEELKRVPTDVIGTEYEKAVARLVAFGVLDGYKDGTYRPDQDVTRAEFAKILVEALGIGNAAKAAAGKVTFKDVPASHWASGYVSTASGYGLLKGFPDGTFKPEQQVSYADALTMLVRALGYQDSFLKGAWPGSHIAKAAEAGITSGVNFADARGFANRGKVAQMVNNTLDCDVVKVETYKDGTVEYKETEKTLLKDKLDISKYEDTRVIADKVVDDGLDTDEITVKFLKEIDKDDESVKKSYKEGDEKDFRIRKGVNTRRYIGEESSVYMDNKDVVVYIETENDDKAYFDYVEAVKGDDKETEEISLVRFDKDYKFDKDAKVYVYDAKDDQYKEITVDKDGAAVKANDLLGRVGKFVVKNNRVIYAEIMESAEALPWMLVKENKKGLLEGINQTTEDFDLDLTKDGNYDGVLVFDTLGNPLDVEEIKEGNIVYVAKLDYDGDDYAHVVVVQDNMVEGKLEKVKDDRVTIDNKQIKMVRYKDGGNKFQTYYSVEGFEDIKEWYTDGDWEDDMEDADEEDMVAYLDATGKIAFLSTKALGSSGYKYGVVTRAYADNDRVKIFTFIDGKDGDEITYRADKEKNLSKPIILDEYGDSTKEAKEIDYKDLNGRVVKFKLNKDGEIAEDEFYVMLPENTWKMQENKDFGKDSIPSIFTGKDASKRAFAIDDKAVIIDAESLELNADRNGYKEFDSDDFSTANWKDIAEDNYDKDLEFYVFTKRNNKIDVDAVVFIGKDGLSTSSDEEAIYVYDKHRKAGDVFIKYVSYETGKEEEIEVDKIDKSSSNLWDRTEKERPYVARIKSGNKVELFTDNDSIKKNINKPNLSYVKGVVSKKDGSVLTVNKEEYRLSSSAIVYEEDTKKYTSNIMKNDAVFFVVENGVNIRVIERLIDDEAKAVKDGESTGGTTPTETGKVDYVNDTRLEVDGKTYKLDEDTKLYNVDGKTTLAIGGKDIATELKKLSNPLVKNIKVNKNDVVESLALAESETAIVDRAEEKVDDLETAIGAGKDLTKKADLEAAEEALTEAKAAVKVLKSGDKKTELEEKIKTAEEKIKAAREAFDENAGKEEEAENLKAAKEAVVKVKASAEAAKDEETLETAEKDLRDAKKAIAKVSDAVEKAKLEAEIVAVEAKVNLVKAQLNAAIKAVNSAKDKFDLRKAVNDNKTILGVEEEITPEIADYVLTKRPTGGYETAKALNDAIKAAKEAL